jgi:hypothetical protein
VASRPILNLARVNGVDSIPGAVVHLDVGATNGSRLQDKQNFRYRDVRGVVGPDRITSLIRRTIPISLNSIAAYSLLNLRY